MNTSRLFFLIGSVLIPLLFGVLIPLLLGIPLKINALWVGVGSLVCASLPRIIRDSIFYPINKTAMLIGYINQTIIMGVIFYGLFMPISLIRKIKGADPLSLKKGSQKSYWRDPDQRWIDFNFPY